MTSCTSSHWLKPLTSIWPHMRRDVGLVEGEYWKHNCLRVTVLCTIIMVHKGTSSFTGRSTVSGFDLAWFSSLIFRTPLSWCYVYVIIFLHTSFSLLFSELSLVDWPLIWLTNHCPSVLWHCWLGRRTRKIVSEVTYSVLSGPLNPAVPYRYID